MKILRLAGSLAIIYFLNLNLLFAQQPIKLGKVKHASITEISGIIPYSYMKGYFWVHNDSGDGANVYLIDSLASLKVKVELEGVRAVDIEDIARVKIRDTSYLLLADIGNNLKDREVLSLYIFEEPKVDISKSMTLKVPLLKEIRFKYADKRRDAEALFVDPLDNHVYILSKRDLESTVFKFPLNIRQEFIQTLSPILKLPFTFTTAADISADGKHIVAKNLTHMYLWERKMGVSVINTLNSIPTKIPYIIEPQGEAVCFDLNLRYLFTISERPFGLDSYLYKYEY